MWSCDLQFAINIFIGKYLVNYQCYLHCYCEYSRNQFLYGPFFLLHKRKKPEQAAFIIIQEVFLVFEC